MLYYLSNWLSGFDIPGSRLFEYVTFRSGAAFVLAILIAIIFGRSIINKLQRMQIGEVIRNLGLENEDKKRGTPTMGGVIIILAIVVPCLLVSNIGNHYMILMLITTLWLGILGFLDDFMKFKHHNKDGIKGKYKIIGQVGIGFIVAATMYLNPNMVVATDTTAVQHGETLDDVRYTGEVEKAPVTTIPFVKDKNFDYSALTSWMGDNAAETGGWIFFIFVTIFLVTATSNGANLNDGMDGLATGCSAIAGCALIVMAYMGASVVYSSYLNIMYVPGSEELVVYMAAFIGGLIGFLWYNTAPAQVFMGDTGSLTLGGVLAVFAILIHKELLLPILCAIFYFEDLSVILQTQYYKRTHGKRIFKMTPLHHHFQKADDKNIKCLINWPKSRAADSKIVVRFWIIAILMAVFTFVTLKIR